MAVIFFFFFVQKLPSFSFIVRSFWLSWITRRTRPLSSTLSEWMKEPPPSPRKRLFNPAEFLSFQSCKNPPISALELHKIPGLCGFFSVRICSPASSLSQYLSLSPWPIIPCVPGLILPDQIFFYLRKKKSSNYLIYALCTRYTKNTIVFRK